MRFVVFLCLAFSCNLYFVGHFIECKPRGQIYVSKYYGKKALVCGTQKTPCKTLQEGIHKLRQGGELIVDGYNTSLYPYKCESSAGKLQVKKNISIQSYNTTAHISCTHGILFTPSNPGNVVITGMQFDKTPLFFKDTFVEIQNCSFTASAPAMVFNITDSASASYSLNIQNAKFTNNHGCIQINVKKTRGCITSSLNLRDTLFQNNTTPTESAMKATSLISVNCSYCHTILFLSSWKNVTAIHNQASREDERLSSKSTDNIFLVDGCEANLDFAEVRSINNTKLRFLDTNSGSISISIRNSIYQGHHIAGPGGVLHLKNQRANGEVNVSITDSSFNDTSGSLGGILQVGAKEERGLGLRLNMYNVTLLQSYGSVNGCAVSVFAKRVFGLFDFLRVEKCHNPRVIPRLPAFCLGASEIVRINIQNSRFKDNKNQVFLIEHTSSSRSSDISVLDIQIRNTTYINNSHSADTRPTINVSIASPEEIQKSVLNISESIFKTNTGIVIAAWKVFEVYVKNSTFKKSNGVCLSMTSEVNRTMNSTLHVENCKFDKNKDIMKFTNTKPLFINITIKNTTFRDNHHRDVGIGIQIGKCGDRKDTLQWGQLVLDSLSFTKNHVTEAHGSVLAVVTSPSKNRFGVIVRHSLFQDNCHEYKNNNTAFINLFYFYIPPKLSTNDYTNDDGRNKNNTCGTLTYHNRSIYFKNVTFSNNVALTSALFVASGKIRFQRCRFEDNFSYQPNIGAHVYVDKGPSKATFYKTRFIQTKKKEIPINSSRKIALPLSPLLYIGAQGPLNMKNTSLTFDVNVAIPVAMFIVERGYQVHIDNQTTVLCPIGSYLKIFNATFTLSPELNEANCKMTIIQLKFSCQRCPFGKYTLIRGSYQGTQKEKPQIDCIECPFGANCTQNVKSMANFWGYIKQENPPKLKFTKCPGGYCEEPRSNNLSIFNKCVGERDGTMCGACKKGFTENMFNHRCCSIHKCRDHWFWLVAGLYSTIMAILILCRPSLILFLIKKVLWFREKRETVPNSRVEEMRKTCNNDGHACFKITFYFYQVAELLMLESYSELAPKLPFLSSVISFFNFEVDIHNSSFGCPFPGLTAATKEIFRCSQVFAVMIIIVVIYLLHWLFSFIQESPRPHFARYLSAIIEVLLLGYERLGHMSFKLLNCAPLEMPQKLEWRLVLDGNITCWVHWWQFAMIAYNIVFVIPFLLVLLVGTSKLKRQKISAFHFVAACFVPLPFLLYWMLKRCLWSGQDVVPENSNPWDQERRNALLMVLHGPFRQPSSQSNGALYWESILIGRRLVLLCLYSFIATLLPRLLCMTFLCILILIHNIIVMPYKNTKANFYAIMLLSIHVVMATINLGDSVLITAGVPPQSPLGTQIDGFKILEIILLSVLPCAFVLLVAAVVVSQTVRLLLTVSRYCLKNWEASSDPNPSCQPLLTSSEEDSTLLY